MASRQIELEGKKFQISYILDNHKQDSFVLFLHGWGSNKELMRDCFGRILTQFNHLYVDLPGFGKSSNDFVLTSMDYVKIIQAFLQSINITPQMIVGHSFGGKIATLLQPKILILLSSAGIPKEKSLNVRFKIKIAKILKILGIKNTYFRTKDAKNLSENMYQTLKNVVDEDYSPYFAKFPYRALIFWGRDDNITPLFLGEKIKALIQDSKLFVLEGNHYFFLNQANSIDRIINGNIE